ncbi:hypothetical protein B0H11DRAFT_2264366 [Mycena galericulata]|nr:hypothetical protein B0H11DRAFT_2264366 [Mycena galericulata]
MSRAEFEDVKAAFLTCDKMISDLDKYKAPIDERRIQLGEVGAAAARLQPFTSLVMGEGEDLLREAIFHARNAFNNLFNPDNKPNFQFPAGYNSLCNFTHIIQAERKKKEEAAAAAVAPAPPSKPVKSPRLGTARRLWSSSDEEDIVTVGDAPAGEGLADQMNVDDDSSKAAPAAKGKAKRTPAAEKGGHAPSQRVSERNKRQRTDEVAFYERMRSSPMVCYKLLSPALGARYDLRAPQIARRSYGDQISP